MTTTLLDAARRLHQAGLCVVPAKPDGSKAPFGAWKQYQTSRSADGDLTAWFANGSYDGLGVITGAVSGQLEMFEAEGRALAEGQVRALAQLMADNGFGDLWERIDGGYCEVTPSGGLHWYYRIGDGAARPNLKLARRPSTDNELAAWKSGQQADVDAEQDAQKRDRRQKALDGITEGWQVPQVLIETRGEGGFSVTAPSAGRTHPGGQAWLAVKGTPADIPTITAAERDALHAVASLLDAMPAVEPVADRTPRTATAGDGLRPGDDFNLRAAWAEILEPHGWHLTTRFGGDVLGWCRPGKTQGVSATTGRNDGDNLYVFSSSTLFETERPYSKFAAYALLEHNGDYAAAASQLRRDGYGTQEKPATLLDLLAAPAPPAAIVETAAQAEPAAEPDEAPKRLRDGGSFILDIPDAVPTIWGDADDVVWAQGEALMIVGPPGVGKTTLTGQLLRSRLGLGGHVLGMPVTPTTGRVLYLAMDRPQQIARALRRHFRPDERAVLDERLSVWEGPPPADIAKQPTLLYALAEMAGADTLIVDSLKDAAIGLGEDEVAGGYNRARQTCLANGVQMLELHHMVKRGANGAKPKELADVYGSTWLTSGAGSVLLLWGRAGDLIVEVEQLKQPLGEFGPVRIIHDHRAGTSVIFHETDLLATLRLSPNAGLTAKQAAGVMFETDTPSPNEMKKAERKLDRFVTSGLATKTEGSKGGVGGGVPAVWRAIPGDPAGLIAEVDNSVPGRSREDANPQVRAIPAPIPPITPLSDPVRPPLEKGDDGRSEVAETDEALCSDCHKPTQVRTLEVNHGYCTQCAVERKRLGL